MRPSFHNKPQLGRRLDFNHPLSRGLIGCWLMNEGAGEYVGDLSGNRNIFDDWTNSPTWVGQGIKFVDADNKRIVCNSPSLNLNIGTGPYTLVVFAQIDISGINSLLAFGEYDPFWYVNGSEQLLIYDGGNKTVSSGTVTIGRKQQIVFCRRSTAANDTEYFIDGISAGLTTHEDSISIGATLAIGASYDGSGGYDLDGIVYSVFMWNRALTASEIASLYAEPFQMFEEDEIGLLAAATIGKLGILIGDSYEDATEFSNGRSIARTSNGDLHAVFIKDDEDGQQVCHAVSTDAGLTWTPEYLTTGSYNQEKVSIAVDSQDNLHVAWSGKHASSATNAQIRYIKYTNGVGWGDITNLSTDTSYWQDGPSIAVDGSDYIHVTWSGRYAASATISQVRYRKFTSDYIHVTWSGRYAASATISQVRYRKFTDSWQTIENLTSDGGDQTWPCVCIDNSNYVHISWYGYSDVKEQVWTRYILNNGSWQAIEDIVVGGAYNSMAIDDDDNIYLTGGSASLVLIRHTDSWQAMETIEDYSETDIRASDTCVSIDNDGIIHVLSASWQTVDPEGIAYVSYQLRYYYNAGEGWSEGQWLTPAETDYNIMPSFIHAQWPQINGARTNRAKTGHAFVWTDEEGTDSVRFYASDDLTWDEEAAGLSIPVARHHYQMAGGL